jgi:cyclopropane fatty-acyl-phospholipid synthase-like methyltransferase
MCWRLTYAYSYRSGHTPWDTGITPPEVVERIEGPGALTPGRALDLGCGTGTNVRYLAVHGWHATGVEANGRAFDTAVEKLTGVDGATAVRGDVTRLDNLAIEGPFDLVLDIGCFHSVSRRRRDDYASGVARRTEAGASLFVWAFATGGPMRPLGVTPREMRDRFAPWFEPVGRIPGQHPPGAAWYLLRRTGVAAP